MIFFNKIFRRKRNADIPPMPTWDTIVEMMYDKHLDNFIYEVVDVIYSKDRSMRYVIFKKGNGLLTYQLEAIYQFDEDEWRFICFNDNVLPAMWEPIQRNVGKSYFENMAELRKEMVNEPEYKQFF